MRNPSSSGAAIGLAWLLVCAPAVGPGRDRARPRHTRLPPAIRPRKRSLPCSKSTPIPSIQPKPCASASAARSVSRLSSTRRDSVVDAKVVQRAGHGFDEAALAAVKSWTFLPARQNERADPRHDSAALALRATGAWRTPWSKCRRRPRADAAPELQKNTETTLVLGRKPISAASSSAVRDRDFALRPIGSVQDILRVTPGLGGGAALGRRQSESVLFTRFRRRSRHRPGAVDRRHPDQHGVARARSGLRRHQLHHSGNRRTGRALEGSRTLPTRETSRPPAR